MIELRVDGDGTLIPVKVVPGASRSRLMGEIDGRLRVAVAAPPERGKANDALVEFLAGHLELRRRDVTVVAGHTSPLKSVRAAGVTPDEVTRRLAQA